MVLKGPLSTSFDGQSVVEVVMSVLVLSVLFKFVNVNLRR